MLVGIAGAARVWSDTSLSSGLTNPSMVRAIDNFVHNTSERSEYRDRSTMVSETFSKSVL